MANEKRLIDANAVKAEFDEYYDTTFLQFRTRENTEYWKGVNVGVNWGRNTIADAPTVDAVEVVRCKDCKKGHSELAPNGGVWCAKWNHVFNYDGFCSDGERKDND